MRKILRKSLRLPLKLLVAALLVCGAIFAFMSWRDSKALTFASSIVSEDSPIAELATRRIVWKVVHVGSTVSTDTVRETVYTMKVGYDLAHAEPPVVDEKAKTVTLVLPPPKIMSLDHFLQRTSVEKKTFVERVFGQNTDDGKADREDVVQLAADCEKFGLLSADSLREGLATTVGSHLHDASGYDLVLQSGLDVPAKVMFNAYFEEKGVPFRLP